MTQIDPAVVTALTASYGKPKTTDYHFLTIDEITAQQSYIKTRLSGDQFGTVTPLEFKDDFKRAFDAWKDVAALGNAGEKSVFNASDILVAAVDGLTMGTGIKAGGIFISPDVANAGPAILLIDIKGKTAADFSLGGRGYSTMLHEIGHALGLAHSFAESGKPGVPDAATDSELYTVMSYNSMYRNSSTSG